MVTLELVITTQRQLINLHDLQVLSRDNPVKINTQPVEAFIHSILIFEKLYVKFNRCCLY